MDCFVSVFLDTAVNSSSWNNDDDDDDDDDETQVLKKSEAQEKFQIGHFDRHTPTNYATT